MEVKLKELLGACVALRLAKDMKGGETLALYKLATIRRALEPKTEDFFVLRDKRMKECAIKEKDKDGNEVEVIPPAEVEKLNAEFAKLQDEKVKVDIERIAIDHDKLPAEMTQDHFYCLHPFLEVTGKE